MILSQDIFKFLKKLANNNTRDWFQANKELYKTHQSNIQIFGEQVKTRLNTFDSISNFKLFRIYRDVRFSKDKTPYKKHFGLTWKRTRPELRGGYYLHLSPGESFLACGFWDPSKNDLDRIRYELIHDGDKFKKLIRSKSINSIWNDLQGNELKTVFPQEGQNLDHFLALDFQHLYLQPMDGIDRKENTAKTIQYCLEHPEWKLSIQQHKLIGMP